jgi:maltose alpha-D-glucosyltransferase/alpha-amylase
VLFVHNLDARPREIVFSAGVGPAGRLLVNVLSSDHSRADDTGRHRLVMEGYGYRWYRVGGLDYLLDRSEIETARPAGGRRTRQPSRQ